jgi:RNA polymerase sigma-70 factor (ECF subfamily)
MTNPTTSQAETAGVDDSSLVALARDGSVPAIDQLVLKYRPEAYRVAARIVRCHEDAEEVAQDALWAAVNHLSTFRMDASFRTWLHHIVLNRSLMALRRKRVKEVAILGGGPAEAFLANSPRTPEQLLLEAEGRTAVKEALLSLPDAYSVVLLFAHEGRSMNEIAAFLGISMAAVKSRLHRARILLRCEMRRRLGINGARRAAPSRHGRPVRRGARIEACRPKTPAPPVFNTNGLGRESGCLSEARGVIPAPGPASDRHLTAA